MTMNAFIYRRCIMSVLQSLNYVSSCIITEAIHDVLSIWPIVYLALMLMMMIGPCGNSGNFMIHSFSMDSVSGWSARRHFFVYVFVETFFHPMHLSKWLRFKFDWYTQNTIRVCFCQWRFFRWSILAHRSFILFPINYTFFLYFV